MDLFILEIKCTFPVIDVAIPVAPAKSIGTWLTKKIVQRLSPWFLGYRLHTSMLKPTISIISMLVLAQHNIS